MTDLHQLAKPDIEAAANFTPELAVLQRRATRIRRRRVASRAGLAGTIGVGLAAIVVAGSAGPTSLDTAGGPQSWTPTLDLTMERIEARGGTSGTEEVTVTFDAPIPTSEVIVTEDIEAADPAALAVAVQGADGVRVCDSTHSFPDSGGGSGSVDLLIPARWFASDDPELPPVTALNPAAGKVIVCGPHEGHVQISIWGGAPMPGEQLDATVSPDRTQITVTISSDQDADGEPSTTPTAECEALYGPEPWLVLFQETPPVACVVVAEHQDVQVWNKGGDDTVVDWIDGTRNMRSDSSFSTGPIANVLSPGEHNFAGSPYRLPTIYVLSPDDSPAAKQPTEDVVPGMTLGDARRAYGLHLEIDPDLMPGPQCWMAIVPGDPYSPLFIVSGPQNDEAVVTRILSVADQTTTPAGGERC